MADGTVGVLICEEYKNTNNTLNDSDISIKTEEVTNDVEPSEVDKDNIHELLKNLSNFTVKRILRNDPSLKLIAVEGEFKGYESPTLVILEKKGFPQENLSLKEAFFNDEAFVKKLYRNDIYRYYDLFPEKEHNGLNVTIIHPATPKHIEKFTPAKYYSIEETPDVYEHVTLPSITAQQFSVQWVNNILEGKAEVDRVIFNDPNEDTGFILVKDSKWNGEKSTLHIIALTRQKLKSIRDLNETHLPLLRNIKESGTKAIKEKYDIPAHQLRIFFHYQPSYYHLHIHFTGLTVENAGTLVERAHLLSTVIGNIEIVPDYYRKATLTFRVCKYGAYKPYEDYLKKDDDEPEIKKPRISI